MSIDWNSKIKEALGRTEFMAISTIDDKGSWTNPVQYGYSERLDLFFVSMMDSKHVQNILKDARVSAAIFKTERFPDGDVLGLQLKGTATHVTDPAEIKDAIRYYGSTPDEGWQFFKVVTEELWCFDSRVFGEKRERVDLTGLSL